VTGDAGDVDHSNHHDAKVSDVHQPVAGLFGVERPSRELGPCHFLN